MARLCVVNFLSVDGVIQSVMSADEDRDGGFEQGGWVASHPDDAVAQLMGEITTTAGGMLLGRRTYELFTRSWRDADQSHAPVAAMHRMPKYVVTRGGTEFDTGWNNTSVLTGDIAGTVRGLLREPGPDLVVFGSGEVLQTLGAHDLIDEYRLVVYPLILGSGKRMFRDGIAPVRFVATESVLTGTGVVITRYVRR